MNVNDSRIANGTGAGHCSPVRANVGSCAHKYNPGAHTPERALAALDRHLSKISSLSQEAFDLADDVAVETGEGLHDMSRGGGMLCQVPHEGMVMQEMRQVRQVRQWMLKRTGLQRRGSLRNCTLLALDVLVSSLPHRARFKFQPRLALPYCGGKGRLRERRGQCCRSARAGRRPW